MNVASDLQAVMDRFVDGYRAARPLSPAQQQVCRHIRNCRTEALGGLQFRCDRCGREVPQYHSCRDRHCPKCQYRATEDWCDKQLLSLLPVTYYHVVFTVPHTLNSWVQLHPEVIYNVLFEAVWATLKTFGADPKRLNGQLGMTAVLHTWGQNLGRHVHVHCLVPGGALGADDQWHPAKSTYLFPIRALSHYFRGRLVTLLRSSHRRGELDRITRAGEVDAKLDALMQSDLVVYSKSCLTETESIVRYLGRYTHRTAISDQRIIGIDNDRVEFAYKDYRDGQHKVLSLDGDEFLRRFLMHVLPKGMMRIRHYGFLANRYRKARLQQIRDCLNQPAETHAEENPASSNGCSSNDPYLCPKCRQGILVIVHAIAPKRLDGG